MATLRAVYASLFPGFPRRQDPFTEAPLLPTDVFAYTAHLLERSGAYHHIVPEFESSTDTVLRRVQVDSTLRERAVLQGLRWRTTKPRRGSQLPPTPARVTTLWRNLGSYQNENVFTPLSEEATAPTWWEISLELMMIADEASKDLGFAHKNPFSAPIILGYLDVDSQRSKFGRIQHSPFSLSLAAEDLVCVQAKSRTPSVGCTLRSLSHHLALLPPRGQVRARWVQSPFPMVTSSAMAEKLGLLLVPFPYRVDDRAFRPSSKRNGDRFGWFSANHTWLPQNSDRAKRSAFIEFVQDLVANARDNGMRVDGVVLPELALNFLQFRSLAQALVRDAKIDFLIAGIDRDQKGRRGNFAAIAPFFLLGSERSNHVTGWDNIILIREKHHRWKLDPSQISAYGFHQLDKNKSWWEDLDIMSRSLDVLVYRGESTLTTLICEDLARVDPCQAVVRAIGPNLLVALLMDGPQIAPRWPGRYATALADDPGTSVLSLTSFGLIARQNDIGAYPQIASSVALWKDEATGLRSLDLPRDADAIVLQIKPVRKIEHTLDGRSDDQSAHRWEYDCHQAVSVGYENRPAWLVTGIGR